MNKLLSRSIAPRLVEARRVANEKPEKWAALCGMSYSVYSSYENPGKSLKVLKVIKICKRLSIRANWLLLGQKPIFNDPMDHVITDEELLDIKRGVHERLKKVRIAGNWGSVEEMSNYLNMPPKYYSTMETGKLNMSIEMIIYLCGRLKIEADWILLGEEPIYLEPPEQHK